MYRLIKFGDQSLKFFNQVDDVGSGETPTAYSPLPDGGALDLFGNAQKHPSTVERVMSRRIRADNPTELQNIYFKLLALRGTRDRLYRQMANGDIHWIWARLVSVNAKRDYQQARFKQIQDVELKFITQEATWHGKSYGTWYLDDGHYFDDGLAFDNGLGVVIEKPGAFSIFDLTIGTIDDPGRAPIRNIKIILNPEDADDSFNMTLYNENGGVSLGIDNPMNVAANSEIIINTGTLQVWNDGEDAYQYLTSSAPWLIIYPGLNQFTFGSFGVSPDLVKRIKIDFLFDEAWY